MPLASQLEHPQHASPGQSHKPESMSLRRLCYELNDQYGENLIHAMYPSNDSTKFVVLCSNQNKEETLDKLHHVREIVEEIYDPSAKAIYFSEGSNPSVQHYPKLTDNQTTMVESLVNITATMSAHNPQDESEPQRRTNSYVGIVSQSPPKRHRNGHTKEQSTKSYLPEGFTANNDRDVEIKANLNETMVRLKQMESNDVETKESLSTLSSRLDQQGRDISTLGQSLQQTNEKVDKVCDTQVQQFTTMNQMNGSLSALLQQVSKLNDFNQQFSSIQQPAESPQGGVVKAP